MRNIFRLFRLGAGVALLTVSLYAQDQPATSTQPHHGIVKPGELQWSDAPPALPKGAKIAVLQGDPNASGPFTIRLKVPAGYKIPLHTHPTDEVLTVISGNVQFQMGSAPATPETAITGSFLVMPAGMQHSAAASGEATMQVSSQGPFVINYVNSAEDPRQRK